MIRKTYHRIKNHEEGIHFLCGMLEQRGIKTNLVENDNGKKAIVWVH